MSIVGGVGMFSTAIFRLLSEVGLIVQGQKTRLKGLQDALELATGQHALLKMMTFPAILIVLFIIFIWQKNSKKTSELEMTMSAAHYIGLGFNPNYQVMASLHSIR